MTRHGGTVPVPVEAALSADPELWLVNADPAVWERAHPCECEATCVCDLEDA